MPVWGRRWVFSLNSFFAAMAALYIALSMGLLNPFWSMMTVYVVSQPQAGSVRSKALYRLLGTLLGAIAAVALVPNLANAPELLSLALALWVGLCLGIALLDRTPRAYVFMLGGYTAALIGFPSVGNPGEIFDVAVARAEEIGLGIVCATLAHSLFLPQHIGTTLTAKIEGFMRDAREWTIDALASRHDPKARHAHKLAADVTELTILATHLPFDISDFQTKSREVAALAERMAMLLPLAAAVGDRLRILRAEAIALPPETEALIADVTDWIQAGADALLEDAVPMAERARGLEPEIGVAPVFHDLVSASFHARLAELIESWRDCRVLARHLALDHSIPEAFKPLPAPRLRRALHRDYGMALWSGLAATAAILAICAFWILSGWAHGGVAAMMTAIFMCFFASLDDPAKAIDSFALSTIASIPVAAIYMFAILPQVHAFATLALILAPFLLAAGVVLAMPRWGASALAVIMGAAGALALQESFTPDFAHFINASTAMISGVLAAAIITRLIRTVGADFSAARLIRLSWRDIARNSTAPVVVARNDWISVMVDRAGLLGPRLAASDRANDLVADTLGELRIGLNIIDLRQLARDNPATLAASVDRLLGDLRGYFTARARGVPAAPPAAVLSSFDAVIQQTSRSAASTSRHSGLIALTGLRRALFPDDTILQGAAA